MEHLPTAFSRQLIAREAGAAHRAVLHALLVVLLAFINLPVHADDYPWLDLNATEQAVGDVHIGMPLKQASSVFVMPFLDATWFYGDNECASFAFGAGCSGDDWHIRFLAEDKVVKRIDVYTAAISGPHGFGVGSRMEDIVEHYAEHYEVGMGYDPSYRYIEVPVNNGLSLAYRGIPDNVVVTEGTNVLDLDESLIGQIDSWSIGDLTAGTVEGCL